MTTRIPPYDIPEPTPLTKQEVSEKYAHFESLRSQLASTFRGQIAIRGEPLFAKCITIFNDAAPLGAWMVTLPIDVRDIAIVVQFCAKHRLSPSVKSGGFATAGWSIQGDIIIDTSFMDHVKLIVPNHLRSDNASGTHSSPLTVPVDGPTAAYDTTVMCADRSDEAFNASLSHSSQSRLGMEQFVKPRKAKLSVTSTPDFATKTDLSKSHSSEDIDPQNSVKNALKRKAPEADDAFVASSVVAAAAAKRRTNLVSGSYPALQKDPDTNSQPMQHGHSHESGADADSESSYASSSHQDQDPDNEQIHERTSHFPSNEISADSKNNLHTTVAASRSDFLNTSEPRDSAPMYSTFESGSGSRSSSLLSNVPSSAKGWLDRQIDLSGNTSDSQGGSNSGSNAGGTSSQLASSFTSASKQSSAKSSSAGGDHAEVKVDSDDIAGVTTDDVSNEHMPFKRPSTIPLQKRHVAPSQQPLTSRSDSRSGSGSTSDSARNPRDVFFSQTPSDRAAIVNLDHQRWHQHHRPPAGTSGENLKLPEGAFVWRSEGVNAGITTISPTPGSLPWDTEAFAASPEAIVQSGSHSGHSSSGDRSSMEIETGRSNNTGYFGASTLSDLQEAWPSGTWAVNHDRSNDPGSNTPRFVPSPGQKDGSPSPTPQGPEAGNPYNFDSRPEAYHNVASSILPPGLYEDRYVLASFGPGVGIRSLDAFTDRAGREGSFIAAMDEKGKGKEKQIEHCNTLPPLLVNGVPYHVPVSAFPVGSTAMTTGGFGYLTRAYGLSLDNIVEIEMVLPDGRIVTLNDDSKNKSQEEQDLWWAARGAAPCFGIVARLTAKAYPVPSVYSGNLIYPLNPATASSLIRHWRDCLKAGLPRNFYTNLILTAGPSKTSHVIVIQVCYLGPKSDGEALVQAISSWTGERLLLKDVEERSFLSQQDGVAKVLKGGTGRRWMVRGDLISTLTDDVIAKSVRNFQGLGSRAVWLFELMGGAVQDSPATETCICPEARAAKFTVGSLQQWSGKAEDRACIESVERWLNEVVDKVSIGGPYPCFLGRSERMDRVIGAYGLANFKRLLEIKKRVDPNGMFRHTFGNGFTVEDPEMLLRDLEERQTRRSEVQQQQAEQVAQSNEQNSSSQK